MGDVATGEFDTFVVDVDGTLVDSNYHQVLAWFRAFTDVGVPVHAWQLHEQMGKGGDRLVAAVAGDDVEEAEGDRLRDLWAQHYNELIDEVRPFEDAEPMLRTLTTRGFSVVLASSGRPQHVEHAVKVLGVQDLPSVDASDADATKPAPDLVASAVREVGGQRAVMIGDTVWDVQAAGRCGFPTIAFLTGGVARSTLEDAGALVLTSPGELAARLDEVLGALTQQANQN